MTADAVYLYDGSFDGFLSCVFDSYVYQESPVRFWDQARREPTLFPVREIPTVPAHAERVRMGLGRIDPGALELVVKGFLTCAPDREVLLFRFIRKVMVQGRPLLRQLTDEAVLPLMKAVRHLDGEVHLLKGFVRFSDFEGTLAGEIKPKNRVLPLLRPHFCDRMYNEVFLLYDRTHREALAHRPGQWAILPLDEFKMAAPSAQEAQYRRLWKRFYDTIEIKERHNPRLRMTNMPKRYWETMTEFQDEAYFLAGSDSLPEGHASGLPEGRRSLP